MEPADVVFADAPRHSSRITLSQSALNRNLRFLRGKVGEAPIVSSVVKANAFGHGISAFVPMAERAGVRHFSVASSQEARQVLEARGSDARIMIMGILYPEDLGWVIGHGIEFFVFDTVRLRTALRVARVVGRPALVHLEVETGGNRTGLTEDGFATALELLRDHPEELRFEGLATHFAGIESLANQFRIVQQQRRFASFEARSRQVGPVPRLRHAACSAAALAFPDTGFDLVRIGTAQYGFWPSPDVYNMHLMQVGKDRDNPLKRVLTWKTDVMHLKAVAKGDFVGYGTAFQAPRDMTVAVLPVGYSDGYPRSMSNRGHVLIHGRKARIVGLVNMNVTMVDVTDVPGVQVGDEAVLVGRQKRNAISVASFAEFSSALNNEFVSRLSAEIPRTPVA
jgi:alanine racemase